MDTTKWKEPIWKGDILYGSNCRPFWKTWNYRNGKKISGCQELGEVRDEETKQRGFLGQSKYSVQYYNGGYKPLHILKSYRMYKTKKSKP